MERVRDRCPPDAAEVSRPRLPVLAEDLRPEGEDAALEGLHRERQRELRHGVELHLRAKALQRAGTREGPRSISIPEIFCDRQLLPALVLIKPN